MNKKFYLSSTDKILGGVCGGLGEYFNIDPLIVRLVFLLLVCYAGVGFVPYLIIWILAPNKPNY